MPDQIRQWVRGRYVTLGTDGFGRSDSRAALRKHFEVDRNYIAVAALRSLQDEGKVDRKTVLKAMQRSASIRPGPSPGKSDGIAAMARSVEVRVPDMGNFKDVAIIDVLVKPGDTIEIDTPLVTLETDKATMDVPSTAAGVVEKVQSAKAARSRPAI